MAATEVQVANESNISKIESFLHDPSYKEIIENSSTFNSRLCAERRMRMPFIDTQTGVAQSHSNLFMTRKQRMPGAREGQVYTYPAQRWRKTRRQYLTMSSTRWGWNTADSAENVGEGENSSGIPDGLMGEDSRDGSQTAAKDDPKEWFYDELAIEEMETGEEPDPESDEDYYDDTYANRRKRRGGVTPSGPGSRGGRTRKSQPDDTPAKRGRAGRGRKRAGQGTLPYEVPGDAEKPYGCELCGAKYKTRPGLTYHFTHTHKDPATGGVAASGVAAAAAGSDNDSRDSRPAHSPAPSQPATDYKRADTQHDIHTSVSTNNIKRSTHSFRYSHVDSPAAADPSAAARVRRHVVVGLDGRAAAARGAGHVAPSPYCDFCLGDERANKKTGTPEELVSCSDCGRSGHPTCLQFTVNMMVSMRTYHWQCIECKCCSVCGNSDNDAHLVILE
ncbi:unnamed protein product [Leptidea sinapis]|uniref:C2H2-type domain-containing protein n=1 Tax=Leptidea sinapis TaxID=189913 RepID=A0A5E4QBQ0_9NEOP|nr:unnamed protein product [Leptidea sinapis]